MWSARPPRAGRVTTTEDGVVTPETGRPVGGMATETGAATAESEGCLRGPTADCVLVCTPRGECRFPVSDLIDLELTS
jgi:hypothetical protein